MEHIGRWRMWHESSTSTQESTILLSLAVTWREAERTEGELGPPLGFSMKFSLFLPTLHGWTTLQNTTFFKGQIPLVVLKGFDTHLPEGSELCQIGSHGSFQLLSTVVSESSLVCHCYL